MGPFYSTVRQAAIVTSDERRGVDFTFGHGKAVLSAQGAEYGESHVELPIAYEGPEVVITLDPRYLGEFLRVLNPEAMLLLEVRDAEKRCGLLDGRRLRLRGHAAGAQSKVDNRRNMQGQTIRNVEITTLQPPPGGREFADESKVLTRGPFDWDKYSPIEVSYDRGIGYIMNGMTRVELALAAGIKTLPAIIE